VDIHRKSGNGEIYIPNANFKQIECGGVNFRDQYNIVLDYVDERVEQINPVIKGDYIVEGNVRCLGNAYANYSGKGSEDAPFCTHVQLYGPKSYLNIWSSGFEYYKGTGGFFDEW